MDQKERRKLVEKKGWHSNEEEKMTFRKKKREGKHTRQSDPKYLGESYGWD